jgi:putative spermidine/putrescine transport system permease protein
MVRAVAGTLRGGDVSNLEAAARTLGAGAWQRAVWVVLPALRHAMIVGALLVFAISWGEFNVSFLLNTPLHQTYPAALYATYTSNSFKVSSAATVLFLAVVVPVLVAIQLVGGRDRVEQGA